MLKTAKYTHHSKKINQQYHMLFSHKTKTAFTTYNLFSENVSPSPSASKTDSIPSKVPPQTSCIDTLSDTHEKYPINLRPEKPHS